MKYHINFRILMLMYISSFFLSCSAKVQHLADTSTRKYSIEPGGQGVDGDVIKIIEPYKIKVDAIMNDVLGRNDVELVKGKPSSTLTNWFADALHNQLAVDTKQQIDFAIQNYGGIRINSLAAGDVTVGKIYELMPFDNLVYLMQLDSSTIQLLCDKMVESEGWPVSRGLEVEMDFGKASKIMIGGKPLTSKKMYSVAIPDYIANGGDNFYFLKTVKFENTGLLIRDLLISYVKSLTAAGKTITPNNSVRFK